MLQFLGTWIGGRCLGDLGEPSLTGHDQVGPGPSFAEPQDASSCGGDHPARDSQQTEPDSLASQTLAGRCERPAGGSRRSVLKQFGGANPFSDCAPISVASRSTTTASSSEEGPRWSQTAARADARQPAPHRPWLPGPRPDLWTAVGFRHGESLSERSSSRSAAIGQAADRRGLGQQRQAR